MSTTITTTTTVESKPISLQLLPNVEGELKMVRQRLKGLLVDGIRGGNNSHQFIPECSLGTNVLTLQEVERIIRQLGLPIDLIGYPANKVFCSALKILGILIMIDWESLLFESFLHRGITDQKLPLSEVDLDHLEKSVAKNFCAQQYAFLVPTDILAQGLGVTTRSFDKNYILPFYENEPLNNGEGGFGKVYKIKIHPKHQGGNPQDIYYARKEFKHDFSKVGSFGAENEAFKLLCRLKHENIVQLLAAYIHGGVCNMIMPKADHDLQHYLDNMKTPKSNSERLDLFKQFLGVAEALHCIHCFSHEGMEMLGYHHDLKPQNILFHEGKFLITDFGLAHFKDRNEVSLTTWKAGTQSYGPPGAGKGSKVGRTYDIWSFGCILSEVITFAVWGSAGVKRFRSQRVKNPISKPSNDCFHDGENIKNEVLKWLSELEEEFRSLDQAPGQNLVQLVRRTLEADQGKRPKSADVVQSFRGALLLNPSPSPSPDMHSHYRSDQPPSGPHLNGYPQYSPETPHHGQLQYHPPHPSYQAGQSQTPAQNNPYDAAQQPTFHPNLPHLASPQYYPTDQSQTAPGSYIQHPNPTSQHYNSLYLSQQSHPPYGPSNTPHSSGTYSQASYISPSSSPHPQHPYGHQPPPQNIQDSYGQHYYSHPTPQNPQELYHYSSPSPQNSHSPYPQPAYPPPHYSSNPQNTYAPPTHGFPYPMNPPNTYTQSNHDPPICQSCQELAERCPYHGVGRYYTPTPGCAGCDMLKDRCTTHGRRG